MKLRRYRHLDRIIDELGHCFDDGRFRCPHCGAVSTPEAAYGEDIGVERSEHRQVSVSVIICASCGEDSIYVGRFIDVYVEEVDEWGTQLVTTQAHPVGRAVRQFPNTPKHHLEKYTEACKIIEVSPDASACMSRRCLQGLLTEQGYAKDNLADQIDMLLKETDANKVLSPVMRRTIDAIRGFGNFGAHPITDKTTFQIIPVDEGEAEWCIELIEELFSHYFEQPAALQEKLDAANAKLKAAGKKPLKR